MSNPKQTNNFRTIFVLLTLVLLVSLVHLLGSLGLSGLQAGNLERARNYAMSLVEFNLDFARGLGVPANDSRVAFARQHLEGQINSAQTVDEIYTIVLTELNRFELIIREQADFNLTKYLEWIIGKDSQLNQITTTHEIVITYLADGRVDIIGGELLDPETISQISGHRLPDALRLNTVIIVLERVNGSTVTRIREPRTDLDPILHLENKYRFLEQELQALLARTGQAELTGPGIIIRMEDADFIFSSEDWIHDADIHEVVHTLYAHGAKGIAVGERRLVTTSSIRCVGGTVLVNWEPIPVKPLVITAVGNGPELAAALQPIFDVFVGQRGLKAEVELVEEVRLPGHRRR